MFKNLYRDFHIFQISNRFFIRNKIKIDKKGNKNKKLQIRCIMHVHVIVNILL